MSTPSINPGDDLKVVAMVVGANARWSWQIFVREGRILQESTDTFANVADALADGRRHAAEVGSALAPAEAVEPSRPADHDRLDPLVPVRVRQVERWR